MSEFNNIPIGFRFEPTDEELIRGFLLPKIMGFPLPWNGIVEKDVYAAAPWDVFSDIDDSSFYWNTKKECNGTKKTIYVFTKVMKKTSNSKRTSRKAGCGTWSGQTGPKIINNSTTGQIVGYTKMLSFHNSKGDAKSDLGHWIMHEYCLSGAALLEIGERNNDLVLCKITKCVKDSVQQPAAQFSFPVLGNGGSYESRVPEMSTNKRPAEELHGEEFGCKKQKSRGYEVEGCAIGDESSSAALQFCSSSTAALQFSSSSSSSDNDIQISTTTGNSIELHQQENGADCKRYDLDAMLGLDFDVDELIQWFPDDFRFFDELHPVNFTFE